jgi:hypothetical protein
MNWASRKAETKLSRQSFTKQANPTLNWKSRFSQLAKLWTKSKNKSLILKLSWGRLSSLNKNIASLKLRSLRLSSNLNSKPIWGWKLKMRLRNWISSWPKNRIKGRNCRNSMICWLSTWIASRTLKLLNANKLPLSISCKSEVARWTEELNIFNRWRRSCKLIGTKCMFK